MPLRPLRPLLAGLLVGLLAAAPLPAAAEGVAIALLTERTGPAAATGIPLANGFADYLTMLNQRDGGLGGQRVTVTECETGGNLERGLACYEEARRAGAVAINPGGVDLALALLGRSAADRIPLVSVPAGPALAAAGQRFPYAFAPPATAWDGLTVALAFLTNAPEGLEGRRVAYLHRDTPAGRDPVPVMEGLAGELGFSLRSYALPEPPEGAGIWRGVKAASPDILILDGSAGLAGDPVGDARAAGIPLNRVIALGSPSAEALRQAGPAARGFREITWHAATDSFPAFDQIDLLAIDAGLSRTEKDEATGLLYNRGVYAAVVTAEGIRNAQRRARGEPLDGDAVRRGLEAVQIDGARWKELGLTGFAATLRLSCGDHSGHLAGLVLEWNGAKWVQVSDKIAPLRQRLRPRLEAAARAFVEGAAAGGPWPERPEPCERS
ncbi:ABC-type branched-chain amino acid transport systems periplasmic component-like protein [Methylobacterium sp. 4-46]|uniref:ABC transporter substrate-binding protein n=1 Tax=unclassified Methylobacterium TaxID=2615210 RepID=UPI000152CB9B|nr:MULTISPECIES: ABC transporter substrate-binding protein [Methylobacterium]ACA17361.1 ABC-type branched-chain amino acid transport systems periplasmic component-like protein [Methylobacterium sp. 4-46]WFT83048.1 ABC transporter substrate-binding protein [Methylobacterium nodulans]